MRKKSEQYAAYSEVKIGNRDTEVECALENNRFSRSNIFEKRMNVTVLTIRGHLWKDWTRGTVGKAMGVWKENIEKWTYFMVHDIRFNRPKPAENRRCQRGVDMADRGGPKWLTTILLRTDSRTRGWRRGLKTGRTPSATRSGSIIENRWKFSFSRRFDSPR